MSPKNPVSRAKMSANELNLEIKTRAPRSKDPGNNFGLAIARITHVYWEEMRVSIETVFGDSDRTPYNGVEITQASIGSRHFLGAMPEIGDFCVVGWFGANTGGGAGKKSPAILSWMPRPSYFGYDWLPVQDYGSDEGVMETPAQREEIESHANRLRFKMRHWEPGMVGASSSQGSDLVLDESVLLTNRRANEILLRDQDQAIVMRSLQQFHAMSGARIYGGMVQRDAQMLPKEMVYEDTLWDIKEVLDEDGFPAENTDTDQDKIGHLNPHPLFLKGTDGKTDIERERGDTLPSTIDPYSFFLDAGVISSDGQVLFDYDKGVVYGGKSILRINKVGDSATTESLTEYRVELSHTSKGTLPVTEETDGFDVDKQEDKERYIENVLGSVVGNDPFGDESELYGIPLKAVVDDEGARIEAETSELGDQSATLFRLFPIDEPEQSATFTSFKKDGSFIASIGSLSSEAVNINVEGGLKVRSRTTTEIKASKVSLVGGVDEGDGVEISSGQGVVVIKGEGSQEIGGQGLGSDLKKTSISLQAKKSISLQSSTAIVMDAPMVDFSNVKSFNFSAQDQMALKGGRQVKIDTENLLVNSSGPKRELISGPSQGIPINDQGESKIIACSPATGSVGGVVKNTTLVAGDELKTQIGPGNNTTLMSAGTHSTAVGTGAISQTVGVNNTLTSPVGVVQTLGAGNSIVNVSTGAHSVNSTVAIGMRTVGVANLSGASLVLEATASPSVVGPIMCGSDIHPLIGLPYAALGMLPRSQVLAPKVAP
jgi:hypothetical protein